MMERPSRSVIIWLVTGAVLVASMVIIGGITRLTGSGLSITEWNVIMGAVPPLNEHDWHIAFEKYKTSPQFQKVNSDFSVEEFKSIFWWEYIHRLIGRFIGIVFIVPFIYFLVKKKLSPALIRQSIILFILGGFQGFLGWFMVASGLVDMPRVSHYRLAAHLVTAFLTCGYIFRIILGMVYPSQGQERRSRLAVFSGWLFWIVLLQIIYGAFVAGTRAGWIYNTFPDMGGSIIPPGLTAYSPGWLNFLENTTALQFIHRMLAWLIVLMTGVLIYLGKKEPLSPAQRSAVGYFSLAVVLQFLLGMFTLLYRVPLTLAVLHQFGALILLLAVIYLNYHMAREIRKT